MNIHVQDAPQRALGFLITQASLIEPQVYATKYQDIQYPSLIPVDTSAPEWIQSVTYFSGDAVGAASWFSGKAQDVPNVELLREKFETTVSMAAIGYRYDLEELGKAMLLGMNLNADKANAARRVSEEFIEQVAFLGDTSKGLTGLVNNGSVTATAAPADGSGSATTFASKTPDQVLRDINGQLTGIFTGSLGAEMADTLLLPYSVLLDLSTRRIDATNQTTILEWVERNNIYTRTTGGRLDIRGIWGLDTAGSGGTKRMVAYRRDPSVVKMHIPMPFRFLPVWQVGPILFEVPGLFRLGGVDIRRPKSVRYLDGI
ncbi:major capsid family protein [Alsobacter sp. KACC 23698]|uniref:Major capsid family protein n=1 Tax=Alsobacter sp. KACC 23698 TaxID=3149229 RepID=A0AAU7JNE5_9HYPH